jgi:hypothetical protein
MDANSRTKQSKTRRCSQTASSVPLSLTKRQYKQSMDIDGHHIDLKDLMQLMVVIMKDDPRSLANKIGCIVANESFE